ncbi:MAG: ATP-binding protein [Thermoprotei archaeon]|nr:ATP-binding protein [Thermoprotei archaeon]
MRQTSLEDGYLRGRIRSIVDQEGPEELGIVISAGKEPTHLTFHFQAGEKVDIEVGDFVEVPCEKGTILGKISKITIYNEYYSNPKFLADSLLAQLPAAYRFNVRQGRWRTSEVDALGILADDGQFVPPCIPPEPGAKVYKATKKTLRKALGIAQHGLYLGNLWGQEEIKVELDPRTLLTHHVIVLGATGGGKSYFCSVLAEELLQKGIPVLIIDPHGEYSSLAKPNLHKADELAHLDLTPRTYRVIEYAVSRSAREGQRELTVRLTDLDPEALAEICNMTDIQSDLIYLAYKKMLKRKGRKVTLDDLLTAIEDIAYEHKFLQSTLLAVKRRLAVIEELGILGPGFKPQDMIKPSTATIIDLSGEIEERARRALMATVLKKVFQARKKGTIPPLMVIVDEGHRFAPQDEETYSKKMLRTIAREGNSK